MQSTCIDLKKIPRLVFFVATVGLLASTLLACSSAAPAPEQVAPAAPSAAVPSSDGVSTAPGAAAPASGAPSAPTPPLKLLKTSPEKGNVGTQFTITGEGLPPGREAEIFWGTVDGSYVVKPTAETVQFFERKFEPKRAPFGKGAIDAQGRLFATFVAPEDYGEIHDIYVMLDGQDVAKGGFRIIRNVTITPLEGPIGTPITITTNGLAWKPYEGTLGVRWDNNYTGFMAATTTKGTVTAQIRAAGPPGKHYIDIGHASATYPYLNSEQSPVAHIPNFQFVFTVTKDTGPPPATLDWPANSLAAGGATLAKTTISAEPVSSMPAARGTVSPGSGPILSKAALQASGLPEEASVDLVWVTAVGNRITPSGWSLKDIPLGKTQTTKEGVLKTAFEVPDDLGGWHAVKLISGEKVLTELPFFVERSFVAVSPARVKAGETFTVQIKGVGWTELDNGAAVTYDNSFIGYACGFNSQGDVTMYLTATGGPGTHLIDLYPMIYQGQGKPPWSYETPILSFKQDAPGLALGYRIPAFRLAIEVVP